MGNVVEQGNARLGAVKVCAEWNRKGGESAVPEWGEHTRSSAGGARVMDEEVEMRDSTKLGGMCFDRSARLWACADAVFS